MKYSQLLEDAHTISDIVDVIRKCSSFTRCTTLKGIAVLLKVSAITQKISEYHTFIDNFCLKKLAKTKPFLSVKKFDFTPSTTITFKLRWCKDDATLSEIQALFQQAFDEHGIDVEILAISVGCVRVISCAPQYLMTELVRLAQKNWELLVNNSVTYLRVGDTIVVDTSDQNEVRSYNRNTVSLDFHHPSRNLFYMILSFNKPSQFS